MIFGGPTVGVEDDAAALPSLPSPPPPGTATGAAAVSTNFALLLSTAFDSFRDLEALWWVYRRGTADQVRPQRSLVCRGCDQPWHRGTDAGRLRMDETKLHRS